MPDAVYIQPVATSSIYVERGNGQSPDQLSPLYQDPSLSNIRGLHLVPHMEADYPHLFDLVSAFEQYIFRYDDYHI